MTDIERAVRQALDSCQREILDKNDREEFWRETAIKNAVAETTQKILRALRENRIIQ